MPHVNPPLPADGENADAGDVTIPFLALLAIFNGHIASDNIEPGSLPWSVMASFTDSIPAGAMQDNANIETFRDEAGFSFLASGFVLSTISGLNGSSTAGVAYVNGKRAVIGAVASKTYGASQDTYVSVSDTGSIGYSPVANGAAVPALPGNSMWRAKVVTNGSNITSIEQFLDVNQWNSVTLTNSWINYDATETTYPIPKFRKDITGQVFMKGLIKNGTLNTSVLTLPFGCRPAKAIHIPIASNGLYGQAKINPDGTVVVTGSNTWADLSNIKFYAET